MADAMVGVALPDEVRRWGARTAPLIAGATLVRLLFVSTTGIANGEAYYYVWSRFPALSYYDHPPLVAWMTWVTTRLSHGSLAVRVGPVLCAALFAVSPVPPGRTALLAARRLPRGGHRHRHPGLLRLELRAQSRGARSRRCGCSGCCCSRGCAEHDEAWRPLAAGLVAGLAFLAKYSGVLLLGVGAALPAGLPHGSPLAPPSVALPRRPGGPAGRAPGADLEPPARVALAGAPLRRAQRLRPTSRRSRSTPGTRSWASSCRSIR